MKARNTRLNALDGLSLGAFVGLASVYARLSRTLYGLEELADQSKKRDEPLINRAQAYKGFSEQAKRRAMQIHDLRNLDAGLKMREGYNQLEDLLRRLGYLKFDNTESEQLGVLTKAIKSVQSEINETIERLKTETRELSKGKPALSGRDVYLPSGLVKSLSDLRIQLTVQSRRFSQISSRISSRVESRSKPVQTEISSIKTRKKMIGAGRALALIELFETVYGLISYPEPDGSTLSGWMIRDEFLLDSSVPAVDICEFVMKKGFPNEISSMRLKFARIGGLKKAESRSQTSMLQVSKSSNANAAK
ncbi:MAG: hypothetical protein JNM39_14495 [Bdellovibrionaceae bacterium]|nr:hypothetical protein [Pseudobdellovibrionaceae bacterium]